MTNQYQAKIAEDEGIDAAKRSVSKSECPYVAVHDLPLRMSWLRGWSKQRQEMAPNPWFCLHPEKCIKEGRCVRPIACNE